MQCCYVLKEITALSIPERQATNPLSDREDPFYNSNRMGNSGWNKCPRQRTERFTVYFDPLFPIQTNQTVYVLPVFNRAFDRNIFGIRNIIRNSAPFVIRKATGNRNFCQ